MIVLLHRTTADFPYRAGSDVGDAQSGDPARHGRRGAGPGADVTLPVGRSFGIGGWASIDPQAPDERIDRLAGLPRRMELQLGLAGSKASPATAPRPHSTATVPPPGWATRLPGQRPWISWHRRRSSRRVIGDHAVARTAGVRLPARVRFAARTASRCSRRLASGRVRLPHAVRTRGLRIYVLCNPSPLAGTAGCGRRRWARSTVPGLRAAEPAAIGPARATVRRTLRRFGRTAAAHPRADRLARRSRRGPPAAHPRLRRRAFPPAGPAASLPRPAAWRAPTTSPSVGRHGARSARPGGFGAVRSGDGLSTRATARRSPRRRRAPWLVLAESYSAGWRAWCYAPTAARASSGSPCP